MRTFFILLAVLLSVNTFAQYRIGGKVSTLSKNVLPGATVTIKGTTIGTVTDKNGNFKIENIEKSTIALKVSFIGYSDFQKEITVDKDISIDVVLEEKPVLTEEVFVQATRAGKQTPVASTMVKKEQIQKNNLGQDVPFLLSTTPSFVTTSDAGTGVGYTGFRIRGTDANRINVSVNGIPLNDAESHCVYWVNMPDFSSSVENIEVQRGVGTSTHGAAAFGATINMQTNTLRKNAYAEYSASAGSFNTMKNTFSVGSGLIADHFSFDARLSKITSDGFIDRGWSKLKSFYVSGGYYTEKTILKVNVFSGAENTYQAWNGIPSVRLNSDLAGMKLYEDHWLYSSTQTQEMIDSDPRTYNLYTYENETDNYQQDHYQMLFSHQFNPNLNFNAAMHYTYGRGYYEQFRADDDFEDYALQNVIVGADTITSTDLIRRKWLDNRFYGGTFSLQYTNDKLDFTMGSGWNKYDGNHFGNIIWAQYASNGAKDFEWYRSEGVKTDFNVYAKANYGLTEKLNLFADVQYRNILYSIEGIDDDLRDLTQDHTFDFVNPKLGLTYFANSNSKAYLSWAMGHREPNRSNFTDADPNGKQPTAETLNDLEAGYDYHSENFSAGANLYYMRYKDQLILTGEINDVGSAIMTNVDDSYRMGVELMATAKIVSNLVLDVNTTLSQNRILNFTEYVDNWDTWGQDAFEMGTTTIAFSPSVIANGQLTYSPLKNLGISLISQFVGSQFIDNSSSTDRSLDSYFVNNLKVSYSVYPEKIKEIEFHLLVNNLLNEEYETNAWVYSYLLGGQRYKMDGYFPQAGTNFLVGVNIRF